MKSKWKVNERGIIFQKITTYIVSVHDGSKNGDIKILHTVQDI